MRRAQLRRARLAAVDLLATQETLTSLYDLGALRVPDLSLPVRVLFESFGEFCRKTGTAREALIPGRDTPEGITVRRDGLYIVLYDERVTEPRRTFTLAHEVGHILLGHAGAPEDRAREEREANAFAASLLCPACVARYLAYREGPPDAERLASLFPLSREAAARRARELAEPACAGLTNGEITLLFKLFGRAFDGENEF